MSQEASTDLLYGLHPVLEALRSKDRDLHRIYLEQGRRGRTVEEILELARARHVPVAFEPREGLDRRAGTARHQGAVGVAAAKAYLSLDDLLESISGLDAPLLLVLDGIEDPHNLGAILRTAEAAGAQGVILPTRRAVGLTAAVAKVSAGAVEHLPVARVVNLSQAIERLKEARFWIYGLDAKPKLRGGGLPRAGGAGGGRGRPGHASPCRRPVRWHGPHPDAGEGGEPQRLRGDRRRAV
jgi:23S rRNA (guanosine2251-2'-O)-methyltransferase